MKETELLTPMRSYGADGIGHESLIQILHVAIFVDHIGTMGYAKEGTNGVEYVDEQERQYGNNHVD